MSKRTKIDLMPFCGDVAFNFEIRYPWRRENKMYATDGRILIRCDHELVNRMRPNPYPIFAPISHIAEWRNLPRFDIRADTETVMLGAHELDARYVELVQNLPGVQWWADEADTSSPVYFRFDGGEVVLMPIAARKETDDTLHERRQAGGKVEQAGNQEAE
jgi:hypothetical protein